jgi:hypothetical protein
MVQAGKREVRRGNKMKFDPKKVRTEWSDGLDGKEGWFSDYVNSVRECCLGSYVEEDDGSMYGVCSKGKHIFPFCNGDTVWKYFYPKEDTMEFDKRNLFIAGYNDDEVNIGDEGIFSDTVYILKNELVATQIDTITAKDARGFVDTEQEHWALFYRTKCAPKKKYIPWTDETVPDDLLGKIVKSTDGKGKCVITYVHKGWEFPVMLAVTLVSYKCLFEKYTFTDGTPCGQEVAE